MVAYPASFCSGLGSMTAIDNGLSDALANVSASSGDGLNSPTNEVITAMLNVSAKVSSLMFSPGRVPQVGWNGALMPVEGLPVLSADDTRRIANDLIGELQQAKRLLQEEGSADLSYSLSGASRFRVNVFCQRGSYAIVMRVIPHSVPTLETLNLPSQLGDITNLNDGIVLVTGASGSGKSSTLAAMINKINQENTCHIVTIEDPIEFLHFHKGCTVHQRELHTDTPSFSVALRSAMRQEPKVIFVGEIRDRETMEIVLEAAESGHLVMSTLNTSDASKTVERIIGAFPVTEQSFVRQRLSKCFRYIISQRLLPRKDKTARVAAIEILRSTMRTRECMEKGDQAGQTLLDAIREGDLEGMQCFDDVIERLIRYGIVEVETGLRYATDPGHLRLSIADLIEKVPAKAFKAKA
jgi:twitching motility protein PilT